MLKVDIEKLTHRLLKSLVSKGVSYEEAYATTEALVAKIAPRRKPPSLCLVQPAPAPETLAKVLPFQSSHARKKIKDVGPEAAARKVNQVPCTVVCLTSFRNKKIEQEKKKPA